MQVIITLGQDTPAYASLSLEVPEGATEDQIVDAALAKARESIERLVFDPSWDFSNARIVSIEEQCQDGPQRIIAEDIPLEPSGEDLGLVAKAALQGVSPLKALLEEAERQNLKVSPFVAQGLDLASDVAQLLTGFGAPKDVPAFQLVVGVMVLNDYGDGPEYATIQFTPSLIHHIMRLAAVGQACKMQVLHVEDGNDIWEDPVDEFMMRGTDLCIIPGYKGPGDAVVFWRGHPKHADYYCETRGFSLGDLLSCLSSDHDGPHQGFLKKTINGELVVFYDESNEAVNDLVDAYTTSKPSALDVEDEAM